MNKPIKYVAQIRHAREISLHGTADLGFWSDYLREQKLELVCENNRASLMFTAVEAKWMGIAFCELSIGVLVRAEWNVASEKGIYLVQAFNSSWLLTFCERRFFHTPYHCSNVRLDASLPLSIRVRSTEQELLEATMQGDENRQLLSSAHECWEGPIYLPCSQQRTGDSGRLFWAKLMGDTETYAVAASDTVQFRPAKELPVFEWLMESGFSAERWSVRRSATHARSKTLSIVER
jgi:hypothetical protein